MSDPIYYVYAHYRNDTGEIFYIGKGHGKRAWVKKKTAGRSEWWHRIADKHGYTVQLLHEHLTTEEALAKERELILHYGRHNLGTGPLINLTDGGEGGLNIGEETRKKRSESVKKTTDDPTYRKELSARVKSQWDADPERKKKTSETVKARLATPEGHQSLRDRVKRTWDNDPERKQRMSAWAKSNSKTYPGLYDPHGVFHGPITNLRDFCTLHDLSYYTTNGLLNGRYTHSRGWRIDASNARTCAGFVSPDGTIYTDIYNLTEFARTHNLHRPSLIRVHQGKRKIHKGWTRYIPPTDIHTQFFDL